MPLKIVKSTTSARRKMSFSDYSQLSKKKREKSLSVPLKKHSGRDEKGHISIRHQGGGAKRMYRLVDFKQNRLNIPATLQSIEYDPNRNTFIGLIKYDDNEKSYVIIPQQLKIGEKIITSRKAEIKPGNRMPLETIPTGMAIMNIELNPGKGGQLVRAAGTSATILAKENNYAQVRLPSGEIRLIQTDCLATIGTSNNELHSAIRLSKAGRKRHMGIRPTVRGKAMHPGAHPHGGGEGVNPIGLKHPKTPWGKPALGAKTRKLKYSDKYIIRRPNKKK